VESIKKNVRKKPVEVQMQETIAEVSQTRNEFANKIVNDTSEYVDVSVPEIYKEYLPYVLVGFNGATIKIPADGKVYRVHKKFAADFRRKLRHYDRKIALMKDTRGRIVEDYNESM
jgi:hypothetical protein